MATAEGRTGGFRRFGVDEGLCMGCGLCHERAPENFDVPDGEYCSRVTRQPTAESEEAECIEAEEYCPAGGIFQQPRDSAPGHGNESQGGNEDDA